MGGDAELTHDATPFSALHGDIAMRLDVLQHGARFGTANDLSVHDHVRLLGLDMIKDEACMGDQ